MGRCEEYGVLEGGFFAVTHGITVGMIHRDPSFRFLRGVVVTELVAESIHGWHAFPLLARRSVPRNQ